MENNTSTLRFIYPQWQGGGTMADFDLDIIDPNEMIAAVGTDPDGMKTDEVVRVINDISKEFNLVGLTIAEPMPRVAIKIKNILNELPLLK